MCKFLKPNPEPQPSPIPPNYEMPSPKARLTKDQITFQDEPNGTTTMIVRGFRRGVVMANLADTNSLDPLIDAELFTIVEPITEADKDDLQKGDIIVFEKSPEFGGGHIIHQIVEIAVDTIGWYCRTMAVNRYVTTGDPWTIRADWLRYRYRGVLN